MLQAPIDNDMSPLDLAEQLAAEWKLSAEYWREEARATYQRNTTLVQQGQDLQKEKEAWKRDAKVWQDKAQSLQQENKALLELLDYRPPYDQLTDDQVEELSKVLVKLISPYLARLAT